MSKRSATPRGQPPKFLQELRVLAHEQNITPMIIKQRTGTPYSQAWRVLNARQIRCLSWDAVVALTKALKISIVFQLPPTRRGSTPDVVTRVRP